MSEDIENLVNNNYKVDHLKMHETDIKDWYKLNIYVVELINLINEQSKDITEKEWKALNVLLKKKHKISPGVINMNYAYRYNIINNNIKPNIIFESFNNRKVVRTNSGITQITTMMSAFPNGEPFSCKYNCYYCPNEPAHEGNNWTAQPRSYLYHEPAVRRANDNDFDADRQMRDRMSTLQCCGNPIDKLEVMASGGTFGSYPVDYRINFTRDLYYAANTFYTSKENRRERYSMEKEIEINMTADARIIGLTFETRPDNVTIDELVLLRDMNCTRIQIGVQHTNDAILKKLNRGCYLKDTKKAIKNLLNVGFKVDVHLMPDLPFSSPEEDKKMFDTMLTDSDLTFDQAKIYPFSSLDWTVTKKWEDSGEYLHYSQEDLIDVIMDFKNKVHPWIRLNRVIRDIPVSYIHAGNNIPNLRQVLETKMKKQGLKCKCIRCREVKNKKSNIDEARMIIRSYPASGGYEYFISIESPDENIIYGFCRLRISKLMGYFDDVNIFPFLNNCAMVRELHVYGNMTPVDQNHVNGTSAQHRGFGKMLMKKAEEIALENGYNKIAVISGVGVRKYYEKLGYKLNNNYMIKDCISPTYNCFYNYTYFIEAIVTLLILYCFGVIINIIMNLV